VRVFYVISMLPLLAAGCGGSQSTSTTGGSTGAEGEPGPGGEDESAEVGPGGGREFEVHDSDTADEAHGERPSEIESTETHAAMRLFVVDPETGPIQGVVIKMTAPDGTAYYTRPTDSLGYGEVLVPVGQRYEMEYLSLGARNTTAAVQVQEGPRQDIRLTLRYRRYHAPARAEEPPRFVLEDIRFDSDSATLRPESYPRLGRVVEYMEHMPDSRIRIAGHTDNVGNPRANLRLSERRAQAVRQYLVDHGIDGDRIEAVGYGQERPVAPNDTESGRAQNRRIEAEEL
jgi:outer membrane protein OmpA-like peptidoglycan-associated protein